MIFIGTQAKTLNEETFDTSEVYWITPKLDGLRILLYIDRAGIAKLINTKGEIFKSKLSFKMIKNTIFDTEYFNGKFYVFDILKYSGKDIRNLKFSERLNIMKKIKFGSGSGSGRNKNKIKFKKHYPASYEKFLQLCKNLQDKYHDGLIFTPDTDYYQSPLKWKKPSMITIDFKIKKLNGGKFALLTQKDKIYRSKYIVGIAKVSKQDYNKYKSGDIVEFKFIKGRFIPIKSRPDKVRSNATFVINDNLKTILNPPNMKKLLSK